MARTTLQDKWNHAESLIESFRRKHVDDFLKVNEKPEKLYRINGYEIEELIVTGLSASFFKNNRLVGVPWYTGKKPSGWDVAQIQSFYKRIDEFDIEIYVQYEAILSYGKTLGAYIYKECFNQDPNKSITISAIRDLLVDEANKRRQKFEPRDGHSPCAYCGVQTPNDKLIEDEIIGRGRNKFGKACVTTTVLKFCSKQCAAYEQMSREG